MKLNNIKFFAELLHYTQSNVSSRLMKLEKEFQGTFFLLTRSGLEILSDVEVHISDAHSDFQVHRVW